MRFAALLLVPSFLACGLPLSKTTSAVPASKAPAADKLDAGSVDKDFGPVGQNITTAAGAEFTLFGALVSRSDNGDSASWTDQSRLTVNYLDSQNYFAAAETIQVWAELQVYYNNSGDWGPDHTIGYNSVTLNRQSDGMYYGDLDFALDGDSESYQVVVSGDFAFFNGEQWDSNNGANYHQGYLNVY